MDRFNSRENKMLIMYVFAFKIENKKYFVERMSFADRYLSGIYNLTLVENYYTENPILHT